MTLTQLESFVLVARLGSVTAAARTLGVSEPAVSAALASLRQQFEDPLIERGPAGMTLTAGGRRLLPIASQMITLAAEAEDAVRHARGAPERLRVVATSSLAESVAPALLAAFSNRAGAVDVSLGVVAVREMAAVLQERLADVALGPRISELGLETVPVFRYRLILVVAPLSPPQPAPGPGARCGRWSIQTWLVDPDATDPATVGGGGRSPPSGRARAQHSRLPQSGRGLGGGGGGAGRGSRRGPPGGRRAVPPFTRHRGGRGCPSSCCGTPPC